MIDPNNLAAARMTFSDEFDSLSLRSGLSGTWDTNFWYSPAEGNGGTLAGNGEQQWYINSSYAPTASVRPWNVSDGILSLTAAPASPEIKALIDGYSYTSGEINTYNSFSQQYGYFEMRAQLPAGQGFWPAFWLLPANGSWPPELDVMEVLGNDMTKLYTTVHYGAQNSSTGAGTTVADMSQGFHTYGVNWEADKIIWYFDGQKVFETQTPSDMHQPMYMMANLAVGGYWPGMADASTPFPSSFLIDYIRAYASDDHSPGVGGGGSSVGKGSAASKLGTPGPDVLMGTSGSDYMRGDGGNDSIDGSASFDDINGNQGNDTIHGGDGDDWVVGGQNEDVLYGDGGNDIVHGNLGGDTVSGGAGADTVRGGQGDDLVLGGDGDDWLSGDMGADTVNGGAGADYFHISVGAGPDLVVDFDRAQGDKVLLDPGAQFSVSQIGSDTIIELAGGGRMTLQGVDYHALGDGWITGY